MDIKTEDLRGGRFMYQDTPQQRRDEFAKAALTGIMARQTDIFDKPAKNVAAWCIEYADALLAALDKPRG